MKRVCAATAAIFLSTFALVGCGDTSSDSTGMQTVSIVAANGADSAAATAPTINIVGFEYQIPESVEAGQVVAVRNNSSAQHSVTSDTSGLFSVTVNANDSGSLRAPDEPGAYAFHCIYHSSMHGTLNVK
ncbi:cupredoxin domain-containing protein [Rhodococcus sp. IEGM 1379]|uniref:cupredoxin domain-containing protein n=1 Tax=Rhodococcus sp. IEGM 1379 TaxID=3047086 RepID=UPI0024B838A7|nr:cupredoxin domain-containing protein [Rhodococcus sp. IEGM 1379]MDI9913912.1 cupredoxin domain-containing protein [Rhodococcus sp. IEGM 1379]